MRELTYAQAISEATVQCMAADPSVFVAGQNVDDEKGTHGTTREAFEAFGPSRVIDVPNAENAFAGIALGTAAAGMRPLVVHTRADFMLLAMDSVINLASKWRYVYGDPAGVPLVMRGVVGRGWGQGATHSQSLQSVFGHFPGLRVATPATPADAKGLIISALQGRDPVVLLENRGLYSLKGEVPEEAVPVPFGRGRVARRGDDVTIVAASLMAHEAERAADLLADVGVSAEVLDPRSVRPLDGGLIMSSVARTGHLVVADTSWAPFGFSAEVAAIVAESVPGALRSPVVRVTPPDCPAPVSFPLEEAFHPDAERIARACLTALRLDASEFRTPRPITAGFSGPF